MECYIISIIAEILLTAYSASLVISVLWQGKDEKLEQNLILKRMTKRQKR